jgi:hypothetical protein
MLMGLAEGDTKRSKSGWETPVAGGYFDQIATVVAMVVAIF